MSVGQTTVPVGVLDSPTDCRVTLGFFFVPPDVDPYIVRNNQGQGWSLTNAEAFGWPVIDLRERPPT